MHIASLLTSLTSSPACPWWGLIWHGNHTVRSSRLSRSTEWNERSIFRYDRGKKVEDFDFRVNNKCVNRAIFIDTWILNARILEIDIDLSVYPNLWLNRCIGKEMRDGWILSNIIPPVVWVEKFDADLKRMSEGLKRLIPLNLSNYKAISILKFASSISIQMFDQTGWRVPTSDTRFTCGSCKRKP